VTWSYNPIKWGNPHWKKRQKLREIYDNLILILDEILSQSGFNKPLPQNLYNKAREIIKELEGRIKDRPNSETNRRVLRQTKWELFEKLMPSEAKKQLKKFKVNPEKDVDDTDENDEFESWIKELDEEGSC
jgi:DNA replication initiation complex subunit (GINS family)